jgi:Flp pilus assembly protein TadG
MLVMPSLPRRREVPPQDERGAVVVLVAVALPVLLLFVMFAIDVAHWFDYSRNLQNRADAAALAAGVQYGNTCASATPSAAAMNAIGQYAQNYAGAGPTSDLYYPYVAPGLGPNATKNVPNLKAGSLSNYHVLINSPNYWQKGQTSATQSFKMGNPSTVCSSLDEDGKRGPFTDIKVTQDSLPLFLPLLGIKPTITAHARVSLEQGVFENNIKPLAVRDASAIPCVSVRFINATTNTVITTATLTQQASPDPNFPTAVLWENPSGTTVQMPAAASLADVYVQPFLNNCSGTGDSYDDATNSGVNWINVYNTTTPSNGQAPRITTGGVFLTGCVSNPGAYNQYFTSTACQTGITANVAFAPNVAGPAGNPAKNEKVVAVDSADGTSYTLSYVSGTTWHTDAGPTVTPGDGQHAFDIQATQTAGTIGGTTCGTGGKNKPCTTDLGVHQQAFGACNGCGAPNESGPIVAVRLRYPSAPQPAPNDPAQASGRNVFAAGSSPKLVVEVTIQGLHFDAPGQLATILRFGNQNDPATGLIDCGQGSGASADANAITNGCPLYGTPACGNTNFCSPMKIYDSSLHPNGICNPELRQTANPAYTDCVSATPGTRRSKIPGAIGGLIVKNGVCSPNHWPEYSGNPNSYSFPVNDPRAITLIITSPADLSHNNVVPIRNFAVFYVTGWDQQGGQNPNCNLPQPGNPPTLPPPPGGYGNEAFPGTGKKNSQNGAIWGHWIYYTDPSAGGNGTFCNPSAFGVCTPVLSR